MRSFDEIGSEFHASESVVEVLLLLEWTSISVMASTSATLITTLLNPPSIGRSCDNSRCGVLSERRKAIYCGGQNFRARVCIEFVSSWGMQRGLSFNPSITDFRRGRNVAVARASFDVAYEFEDAFSSLSLPLPPEPVLFPRRMLNLKFAVLLMRSAYEAVDALDFIPMDKFQIKFWKLRQSEVEPYTLQCRPLRVKYGDLTDPVCALLPLSFVVFRFH